MLKGTPATSPTDLRLAVLVHSRACLPALGSDSKGVPSLLLAALAGEWREGITFLQADPSYSTACQIKSPLTEA